MKRWYFICPLTLQKIIWAPTRFILAFFGRIEIHGLENLSQLKSNVIFAANHSNEFDVFMIPGALNFLSRFSPIFYTSREHEFYKNLGWRRHFYGGNFFKAWGAYPVSTGLQDYERSMVNLTKIVNDGGNMLIFPEGGTTKDGNFRPAKRGVAYLASVTGKPIVPVFLGGTFHLSLKSLFLKRTKLCVVFGQPIYIACGLGETLSLEDYKKYADLVMEKIGNMRI